jgi:hypothetical protein
MMPLLALGLVVFAALVYACVYRFTGEKTIIRLFSSRQRGKAAGRN